MHCLVNTFGVTISRFAKNASVLWRDSQGGIAILFAILLVPMIGVVGIAVDYSRMLALRAQAQTAADGAALLAVNVAKAKMVSAKAKPISQSDALEAGRIRGQRFFDSYANEITAGFASGSVGLSLDGQRFVARVDYIISIETTLARVLGYNSMTGTASSGTISTVPLHYDLHFLLDNSNSMGLAATKKDARNLYTATAENGLPSCVFGCHVPTSPQTMSNETVAIKYGIKMRIDVLRDATKSILEQAEASMRLGEGKYRFSLSTFARDAVIKERVTDNLRKVSNAADGIRLKQARDRGSGETNFGTLHQASRNLAFPRVKDGLSRDTAKQYLILVTDGVNDMNGPGW